MEERVDRSGPGPLSGPDLGPRRCTWLAKDLKSLDQLAIWGVVFGASAAWRTTNGLA
jgi:hypothetical protein